MTWKQLAAATRPVSGSPMEMTKPRALRGSRLRWVSRIRFTRGGGLLRRRALLVLTVLDEIANHRGIGERRGVAKARGIILGDLAQDAAHDLAGARLRQAGGKLDQIGGCDRANVLAHPGDKFLAQRLARL